MQTPFEALIAANPTPVTLHPSATAAAYDPAVTTLSLRGAGSPTTVPGLFTHVMEAALATLYDASVTLNLADLSHAAAQAEELKVTIDDVLYTVAKIRKRYWGGVQVGWTLMLTS